MTTTPGRVVRLVTAIGAALAMQIAAAAALFLAASFVLADAYGDLFGRTEDQPFGWVGWLLGIGGLVLWIASGAVAARLLRSRAGWWMVLTLPIVVALLATL